MRVILSEPYTLTTAFVSLYCGVVSTGSAASHESALTLTLRRFVLGRFSKFASLTVRMFLTPLYGKTHMLRCPVGNMSWPRLRGRLRHHHRRCDVLLPVYDADGSQEVIQSRNRAHAISELAYAPGPIPSWHC